MDVESLAKQLILKNMTPEQQTAVLESIRDSVKQSKEVQKQRIGQNVAVVVEALKKIEADIRSRYDEVGNAIEQRVANIKDGKDGVDGRDGARGIDGRPGRDGAQGPAGAPGKDGLNGRDGVDGVSVTDAKIDFDGSLIISLSNGREINVGEVVAPDVAEKIRVVANGGGTSQTVIDALASLQEQIDNLIPSQTGNAGKFLTTDGTDLAWGNITTLVYEGTWNASTNTPTLTSSVGTNGHYYVVGTSGSTNLNGVTDWVTGDWAIFNGSTWQKIDQTNLVSSVNGEVGAVVLDAADVGAIATVASADGTITVTTVGTAVDLSSTATTNLIAQVRNQTGATLTKGTVVYVSGAAGNKALVAKAKADADATSAQTYGVIRADIPNNQNGYIVVVGEIDNIDTSAYAEGAQLYLSGTTAGTYTATKPYAPIHIVYVAVVTRVHATQGTLYVKIQNGYEMDELHNVSAQNPTNGQVLIYNESTELWEKHTLTDGTGISITEGAGSITVANTGVLSVAGTTNEIDVSASTGAITLSLPATVAADISGNAATVTNGVYTTGSYSNPTWITALAGSKITGDIAGNAGTVTNGVYTTGSYSNPSWITALAGSKITGDIAGNAGTVTNGVYTTGSYADPSWITSLAGSKITGNISGNAANVTGTVAIANGGTGGTTKTAAFDALSPNTTKGDVSVFNGTNNVRLAVGTDNSVLTADSSQASGVKWAASSAGITTGKAIAMAMVFGG
jgi:hypothetical protein